MGLVEFIVFAGIVMGIAWVGTYLLGYFLPGHPGLVDKLIWGIAVVIVLLKFIQAIGLGNVDVAIPTVK